MIDLAELEWQSDFVLVDAGSGLGQGATMLAAAVDQAVIVSTPEPTSIADAHAVIGRLRRLAAPPRLRIVINQARSASEASDVLDRVVASSRQFLGAVVSPLGTGAVRADPHVPLAVRARKPFLTEYPGGGRLSRRPAPGTYLGPGTPAPASQPSGRILRGPGGTMGVEPRRFRLGRPGRKALDSR